jgi:N-glycosidase YbiA
MRSSAGHRTRRGDHPGAGLVGGAGVRLAARGKPGCPSTPADGMVGFRPASSPEVAVTIYFYGADEVPYGCLSNFSPHGFHLDGSWWPTAEHYFQAQKFAGTRHADVVRRAATASRAAELGRDRSAPLRRDWERVKDDVMRRAVAAKFRAHADIREILLGTGDRELVEDTTSDHYWGRGSTGTGRNMLGRILMRTRTQLRAECDSGDRTDRPRGRR